ncbi:MAG: hypothetical protein ACYC2H_11880 [Thermoplasmatota archaeon]
MLKGTPRPKGAPPKVPKGSVQDALEALESRRKRRTATTPAKPKGNDLDLDFIR